MQALLGRKITGLMVYHHPAGNPLALKNAYDCNSLTSYRHLSSTAINRT